MVNNKNISLKLSIAGQSYPIKVEEKEVEIAKKIEKEINKKLTELQIEYKDIDAHKASVMLLLSYAFDIHQLKNHTDELVNQKLDALEQLSESIS